MLPIKNKYQKALKFILIFIALILCLLTLERYQILNHFLFLPSDNAYDAVIQAALLEHWFHVFVAHDSWSDVHYYYPYRDTIAQTDAYFLVGMAYWPFRALNFNPFISAELAGLLIKSIGFLSFYFLCRKIFKFEFYWALLGAVIFTLSNNMTIHSSRLELDTVALAPLLSLLIWNSVCALKQDKPYYFCIWGLLAGLLLGGWCMTCFYMAWFFLFFSLAFSLVFLLMLFAMPKTQFRKTKFTLQNIFLEHWGLIIFIVVCALVFLSPFVFTFYPKTLETGVRSYAEISHSLTISGIFEVGDNNLLHALFNHFFYPSDRPLLPTDLHYREYYDTGLPLLLLLFFLAGCIKVLCCKKQLKLLSITAITTLITWPLILNFEGHSAWFFVYSFIPGAQALRVIEAYQIFLAFPVIIIAIYFLSNLFNNPIFKSKNLKFLLLISISAYLILEELNHPYLLLDRKTELLRDQLPLQPPKICQAFYVSGWKDQGKMSTMTGCSSASYAHNVTAIMLAQETHIPTVNGIASFNLPGWNFANPNRPDYDTRILAYAKRFHITKGLCRLDLNTKQWSIAKNFTLS